MNRTIIRIDEMKCSGCGQCIPGCPEGALQIIDGKARLISDLFCDGLGACIGTCPEGAITTEEREAEPYDEDRVMENIVKAGTNTIKAHLKHLKEHGEDKLLSQAVAFLQRNNIPVPKMEEEACQHGCPGSAARAIDRKQESVHTPAQATSVQSELKQWPVQLHLINPNAPYLQNADLLISADCVPFAYANFHQKFVKGRIVITLCPKLDQGIDKYIEKLSQIFKTKSINSITIVRMEVPCCGGTEIIVQKALEQAGVTKMVKVSVISINGEIL